MADYVSRYKNINWLGNSKIKHSRDDQSVAGVFCEESEHGFGGLLRLMAEDHRIASHNKEIQVRHDVDVL